MNCLNPFKWRHFQSDIIALCLRWYLRYPLSYRNVEEMMLERGLTVDHTTVLRWVLSLCPRTGQAMQTTLETKGSIVSIMLIWVAIDWNPLPYNDFSHKHILFTSEVAKPLAQQTFVRDFV